MKPFPIKAGSYADDFLPRRFYVYNPDTGKSELFVKRYKQNNNEAA